MFFAFEIALFGQVPAAPVPSENRMDRDRVSTLVRFITDLRQTPEARGYFVRDLLAIPLPDATTAVKGILGSASSDPVLASLCSGISGMSEPRIDWLVPLLTLLEERPGAVREAAAAALSNFHSSDAAKIVGRFVLDRSRSTAARLAGIRALGESPETPESIDSLIEALDDPKFEIRDQARALLLRMGLRDQGRQSMAWRGWWVRHRSDSPVPRMRAILDHRQRELRGTHAFQAELEERNLDLRRQIYDRSTEAERIGQLVGLLSDGQASVRILGIALVDGRIADRKEIPSEIVGPLRDLVRDPVARVRARAIPVIRDLRNPADAAILLSRLPDESDEGALRELINAIGRLAGPHSADQLVPFLTEIYPPMVVGEAADSLGMLLNHNRAGNRPETAPTNELAVLALQARFRDTPAEQIELRERVLRAMANIADPSFGPSFLAHIDDPEDAIKSAAIRGLAALGRPEHMPLLIRYLSDSNATVRQVSAEAVGRLGGREEDLEALMPRLDPNVETVEGIRATAWEAFVRVFRKQEPEAQLRWVDRLDPRTQNPSATPERLVELLVDSEKFMVEVGQDAAQLARVRRRLAEAYADMGRNSDAITYYRQVQEWLKTQPQSQANPASIKMLRAQLWAGRIGLAVQHLSSLLSDRAGSGNDSLREVVMEFIADRLQTGRPEEVLVLTDELLETNGLELNESWRNELEAAQKAAAGLERVQEQERVAELVRRFCADDPNKAELRGAIITAGNDAVPGLVDCLLKLLENPAREAELETELVTMLRQIRPDWEGFPADAPITAMQEALSALRKSD